LGDFRGVRKRKTPGPPGGVELGSKGRKNPKPRETPPRGFKKGLYTLHKRGGETPPP